jgi:type IV secretion system protein VirD4
MTLSENEKYGVLLVNWLKQPNDLGYQKILDFLDCNLELKREYEKINLAEFYKVRTLFNNYPVDVFTGFFLEKYKYNPHAFTEYKIKQEYVLKEKDFWGKLIKPYPQNLPRIIPELNQGKYNDYYELKSYPNDVKYYISHQNFKTTLEKNLETAISQTSLSLASSGGFANNEQLEKAFLKEKGFYIGGGWHFNNDGHMLTVGGSGAGKGVNFIIPALLSPALVASGSSVVVLDPKGENLAICGGHLRKNGYKVLVINPFNIPEISGFGKANFNPFSLTSKNDIEAPKFCDLVAECLIPDAGANSAHWTDSARQYISLYLLYMVATDKANFQNLFEAVRLGGDDRLRYLQKMRECLTFGGVISATAGGIAEQLIQGGGSTEIDSIYSTIRRGTDIFKDLQLRQHLNKSDFDLTKLAHEKTALFVCVNPAELQLFSGWLRVFFGCVFRNLQKNYNPNKRVLMLLDEFPQIGRLREFEMAVAYIRGYNVTIWAIVQDLSQLKKLYWDSWESFVGSASVKMWLPLGADNFTIDYIHNRLPIKNNLTYKKSENRDDYQDKIEIQKEKIMGKFDLIICQDAIIEARGLGNFARFEKSPYWLLPWAKNASPNPFRK